jgi:anthranilate phosphoribosyltransferase
MTPQAAIAALLAGQRLDTAAAEAAMGAVADGEATGAQIGALLALLALRGPTAGEITGFARALRSRAVPFERDLSPVIDTCGTGGDGLGTLNVSTLAALVVATAGGRVVKHGNRGVSSAAGSADLLEGLGVAIECDAPAARAALDATGFTFLFAPLYHPAWRQVSAARREIGVRTVFNVLGPLVNPASPEIQLVGVYAAELVPLVANALEALGVRRALVVHGASGEDEISLAGPTRVALVGDGELRTEIWRPEDAGVTRQPLDVLRGGSGAANMMLARRVLAGESGALQDAVALNAGAVLYLAGMAGSWQEGVRRSRQLLAGGDVATKTQSIALFSASSGENRT